MHVFQRKKKKEKKKIGQRKRDSGKAKHFPVGSFFMKCHALCKGSRSNIIIRTHNFQNCFLSIHSFLERCFNR